MLKSLKALSSFEISFREETTRIRLCYERLRISVDREINGNDPLFNNIERINLRTMHILLHRITLKIVQPFSHLYFSFLSFFRNKNRIDRVVLKTRLDATKTLDTMRGNDYRTSSVFINIDTRKSYSLISRLIARTFDS